MPVSRVGIGAVGCGYWGPNVIRNFSDLPAVDVVRICDADPARLDSVARRHPAAVPTADFADLLTDPAVDAVYLATPVSTHYRLVREALFAGKHVLVEKPIATTVEQAEELAALAESRGLVLMVGHTFVFSPPVRKVKELIDGGTVGPIHYLETTRVNLGLFQKDVSVVWDLAPHDLSIILYWLEEVPQIVSARGRAYHDDGLEDVAFITLEFPSRVIAQIQVSWLAPSKLRRTSVVGRNRMVIYDDLEPVEKVKVFDRGVERQPDSYGEFQLTYRSGDILSPTLATTEPLKLECQHFVECVRTGQTPLTGARSAVDVVRILQAVEQSLRSGGFPQRIDTQAPASALA